LAPPPQTPPRDSAPRARPAEPRVVSPEAAAAALPPRKQINWLVWVLLVLNVLVAGVVVYVVAVRAPAG
jgi:hypothetical protein